MKNNDLPKLYMMCHREGGAGEGERETGGWGEENMDEWCKNRKWEKGGQISKYVSVMLQVEQRVSELRERAGEEGTEK